ncbi:MAG: POT family MFS transporter [Myxococcaceae bacterium]|nr:POT family MFS transporter [Myxococcaceae bacterium]
MSEPNTEPKPPEAQPEQKLPPQIPFIIGNEACERFSFYGMRNVLTVFLIDYLLRNEVPDLDARTSLAKAHFHDFVVGVYLFPLLGGWLADRYWGKYRTIFWLSLVYCLGNFALAFFVNDKWGFYFGLFLIALGSGGIKPCVSAMVGDQFTAQNKHLASRVFQAFYWSINFGSFFASAFIPKLLKAEWAGPRVAFGIPGALMAIATLIFWLGRDRYVKSPPSGPNPHSFFQVLKSRFTAGSWEAAAQRHPATAIEGTRSVLKVLLVFVPIPFFWALFDQKASTWVVQAKSMNGHIATLMVDLYRMELGTWCVALVALFLFSDTLARWLGREVTLVALAGVAARIVWMLTSPQYTGWQQVPVVFEPAQMQLINPALVMILIPLMGVVVYPALARLGLPMTPLRRMTIGMFVAAGSWVAAGLVQQPIDQGQQLNIMWQLGPYVLLTLSEVMVSTSGLEFAYSQAPVEMKGTLMSFWLLTTAIGNLAVARLSTLLTIKGAPLFFFYAGAAVLAGIALAAITARYVMVDRYLPAAKAT